MMMLALLGTAVLAIWNDIAAQKEAEYNNWYTNQHLPERVAIEGFLRGRRFRRVSDDPVQKYFTLYEVEHISTLTSEPYLERLNAPTDWTKRVVPLFLNGTRTACTVTTSAGRGTGGYGTTIEFGAATGQEAELRSWLVDDMLPKLVQEPEIVAAHLCESDPGTTSAKDSTAEQAAMKDRAWGTVRWFVLVESASQAGSQVAREALSRDALAQHGAESGVKLGTFAFVAGLDH